MKSTFGERVGQCLLNIEWRTGQGPKSWSRLFCISLPPTIGFSKYQPSACSLAKLAFHSRQSMEMKSGQCPKTHISQMITGCVSCHLCVSSVEITMCYSLCGSFVFVSVFVFVFVSECPVNCVSGQLSFNHWLLQPWRHTCTLSPGADQWPSFIFIFASYLCHISFIFGTYLHFFQMAIFHC